MAEKSFLGFAITLSIVCAAFSYKVNLVTSPKRSTYFLPTGEPFNITCKGSGDDAEKFSSLKWLNKEGHVLEGFPVAQAENDSVVLAFTDPKEADSGVYKCIAVYEKRKTLQKSVSIIFHGSKPVFEDSYQNITATEKSSLEILCAATGELPIEYEWYYQNELITAKNYSNSSIYVSDRFNESVLTISPVTMKDTGSYTCLANNSHGLSSKIFRLMVLPKNDNDTTNETALFRGASVVNVTTTSIKFDFDVSGPVKTIEVRYSENRTANTSYKDFQYGDDYEIKGLIPAGRYNFEFRVNPSQNNQWSRFYEVVLLPDTPEVIFRSIDSGTIKFEWSFKFEDRMRKTIDRHEITYFTLQMIGGTRWEPWGCPITIQIPECAVASYTISGLSLRVYYEIQLRAHTSSGYSEPFTQKIFFP